MMPYPTGMTWGSGLRAGLRAFSRSIFSALECGKQVKEIRKAVVLVSLSTLHLPPNAVPQKSDAEEGYFRLDDSDILYYNGTRYPIA